jgi:putative endonuclease
MNSLLSYTYILECSNGQYYVGSTTDLERRLQEHQVGLGANFTRKHLPVKLVYYEEYQSVEQAFRRERQLHGWSRAKKEALIKGEFEKLPELSAPRPAQGPLRPQTVGELVEPPSKYTSGSVPVIRRK